VVARLQKATEGQYRPDDPDVSRLFSVLVERYRPLVKKMAVAFLRHAANPEDLRAELDSAGQLALWLAVRTYRPEKGPFRAWAKLVLRRELLETIHRIEHPGLSGRDFYARHLVRQALRQGVGPHRLAETVGLRDSQVRRVLEEPKVWPTEPRDLPDRIGTDDPAAHVTDRELWDAVRADVQERIRVVLTPQERLVFEARFPEDGPAVPYRRLAEQVGVGRETLRQLERRVLAKLGHPSSTAGLLRFAPDDPGQHRRV